MKARSDALYTLGLLAAVSLSACGDIPSSDGTDRDPALTSALPIALKLTSITMNGHSASTLSLPVTVYVTLPGLTTTSTFLGYYAPNTLANPITQFNCSSVHALPGSNGYCTTSLPMNTTVNPVRFTGKYPANVNSAQATIRMNGTNTNFTIDSQGKSSQTCATTWMIVNNIIDGDKITVCWKTGLVVPGIAPPIVHTVFYPAPGELSQTGLQKMDQIATKMDVSMQTSGSVGISVSAAYSNGNGSSTTGNSSSGQPGLLQQQSGSVGISLSGSQTFGEAITITTGNATSFAVNSTAMSPDPDDDLYFTHIGAHATFTDWHDGSSPEMITDLSTGNIAPLKLGWLKGLAQTPQVVAAGIPAGNQGIITTFITPAVAQQFIAWDPFNQSVSVAAFIAANPQRFAPATPAHMTLTRSFVDQVQQINAKQTDVYDTKSTGVSFSGGFVVNFGVGGTDTITTTYTNVKQSTATITLQTADPCIEGTVDLYMDTAFGTVVPVPHLEDSCNAPTNLCTQGGSSSHTLLSGQSLTQGQTLTSCNGTWTLAFESGVLTERYTPPNAPSEIVTTFYPPGAASAVMQTNGDFVVKDASGNVLNDSETSSSSGAYFTLQDNGFLAIYDKLGTPEGGTGGALPALWTLGPGG